MVKIYISPLLVAIFLWTGGCTPPDRLSQNDSGKARVRECQKDLVACRENLRRADQLSEARGVAVEEDGQRLAELEQTLQELTQERDELLKERSKNQRRLIEHVDRIPSAFRIEKERMLSLLEEEVAAYDSEVQEEIRSNFQALLAGVGTLVASVEEKIQRVQATADSTLEELRETRGELAALRQTAERTEEGLTNDLRQLRLERDQTAARIASEIDSIDAWERSRISCTKRRDCPATLDLNREKRHKVSQFLSTTLQALRGIQADLARH